MVSREDGISAINKFIEKKDLKDAVTLFKYLCEIKGVSDKKEVEDINKNPTLLAFLVPQIIDALTIELNLNKITDKNNILITVY